METNEDDDDESFEEEFEEELEEDMDEQLNNESKKSQNADEHNKLKDSVEIGETDLKEKDSAEPPIEEHEMLSRKTSYSDFYVIDKEEEHRLKQIAFERYLADQQLEKKFIVYDQQPRETKQGPISQ